MDCDKCGEEMKDPKPGFITISGERFETWMCGPCSGEALLELIAGFNKDK